jgi:hypothetical protein
MLLDEIRTTDNSIVADHGRLARLSALGVGDVRAV